MNNDSKAEINLHNKTIDRVIDRPAGRLVRIRTRINCEKDEKRQQTNE